VGEAVVLLALGTAGSPSNTMPPRAVLSNVLIHPAVWPQYTNVTDRQDRPVAYGELLLSKRLVSMRVHANYKDKSNGDGGWLVGWGLTALLTQNRNRKLPHTRRDRSRCIWARESHFQCRKITSGLETTTSSLTETANTTV